MTYISFPFDDQDTSEDQYTKLFRELGDTGVAASFNSLDLAVTANGTGMKVRLNPGVAIVRGHCFVNDTLTDVPIAASSGASRIDLVVLRLDPVANQISVSVLQGDASGTEPVPTQTDLGIYELPLGVVYVTAGAVSIAADKTADRRSFGGKTVGCWTTARRPTNDLRTGQLGFNVDSGAWEYWTGITWTVFQVRWANIPDKPTSFNPSPHTHEYTAETNRPSKMIMRADSKNSLNSGDVLMTTQVAVGNAPAYAMLVTWLGRIGGSATDAQGSVNFSFSVGTADDNTNSISTFIPAGKYCHGHSIAYFTNIPAGSVGTLTLRGYKSAGQALDYVGLLTIEIIPLATAGGWL